MLTANVDLEDAIVRVTRRMCRLDLFEDFDPVEHIVDGIQRAIDGGGVDRVNRDVNVYIALV